MWEFIIAFYLTGAFGTSALLWHVHGRPDDRSVVLWFLTFTIAWPVMALWFACAWLADHRF